MGEKTGEPRSLIQCLAIDVQRGNVASVKVTILSSRDWGEVEKLPTI